MDWNKISAIGSFLGAIATSLACIIALWQTHCAYKKKIKAVFFDNTKLHHPQIPLSESNYVSVSIINKGNRKVIITEWAYELKKNMKSPILVNLTQYLPTIFPKEIDIENKLDIYYEQKYFFKNIKDLVQKKDINLNRKVKFSITDMTGQKYYFYSSKKAKDYVRELEEEAEDDR